MATVLERGNYMVSISVVICGFVLLLYVKKGIILGLIKGNSILITG